MVNDSNFLIWRSLGESQFDWGLPRPFVREPEMLSPVVWFVPGDTVSFYINTTNNTALTGDLKMVHESGTVYDLAYTLNTIDFGVGQHVYGSFVVPALFGVSEFSPSEFDSDFNVSASLGIGQEGYVQLQLGDYITQYCWLTSAENAADRTAIVKFRNVDRLFNTRYKYLPSGFYQQFRIRLSAKSEEPELNKTTYRGSTTGKTRHLYSEPRQIIAFTTAEYDRYGHRAMVNMLEHDVLFINNIPFAFAQAYKSNSSEGDALSAGEFAVSDENYATLHRS